MNKEVRETQRRGLSEDLTKDDLNGEELLYYHELMKGIKGATGEEKEEVAHLIETVIEAEENGKVKCLRCGIQFNNSDEEGYCKSCLEIMFNPDGVDDDEDVEEDVGGDEDED